MKTGETEGLKVGRDTRSSFQKSPTSFFNSISEWADWTGSFSASLEVLGEKKEQKDPNEGMHH